MKLTVTMPASVEDAQERLEELDRLMTASGWELAAILATFIEPDLGHGGQETVKSDRFISAREFAARGNRGLTSHNTVLRYVNAWMTEVGTRPEPGRRVTLPDKPWPPEERSKGSRTTANNIADTLRTDPLIAAAAAMALADPDLPLPDEVAAELYYGARERVYRGQDLNPPPLLRDPEERYSDKSAVSNVRDVVDDVQAADGDKWKPSAATRLMWALLGRMLGGTPVDWDEESRKLIDAEGGRA